MTPRIGWYGDDFTGATDTLATVAATGQRTLLFLTIPTPAQLQAAGPLDAIGIAGAARTMAPAAMAAELAPIGAFFASQGVQILHYKCCSTFDSAPGIGNIATAIRTLHPHAPNPLTAIIGGQPSIGRYCLFSTLFAAAGQGGVVHRLDRHPTMAHHPVTPMQEADLRRHLAAQGLPGIAALPYTADPATAPTTGPVLFDVARTEDLAPIGALLWRHAAQTPLLAIGPSSVAQALLGLPSATPAQLPPPTGPVFAFIGSLSPVSRTQMREATGYTHHALTEDPAPIIAALNAGRSVMVHTPDAATADPALAATTARFIRTVVDATTVTRIGIAGGDTSTAAAQALGLYALAYDQPLEPGVTLCRTSSDIPRLHNLELMLKGGQMGSPGLFQSLLTGQPK